MSIAWFLLVVLAGMLALLAIPVEVTFSAHRREGWKGGFCAVGWLFGAVKLRLFPRTIAKRTHPQRAKNHSRSKGVGRIRSLLQAEQFAGRLLRLGWRLRSCIRIRELNLNVRLGLDDPADTGQVWGMVGPLVATLRLPSVTHITISPDFAGEVLEIDAQGHVRVIPLQLLAVILVFVLSPVTLRAFRDLRIRAA